MLELLNGQNLPDKQHEAILLLSMDENQFPHVAMISVGEIVAIDETELRLSLWRNTVTTTNLSRTGQATFVVIFEGVAYYVKISVQEMFISDARHDRQCFVAKVVSFRADVAKYADIVSGVRINLKEPEPVLQRWEETVADLLR
ncbi:pyridoxamine 5'-phosphate oxidase family protein [Paenibacillus glacialis]|uniref:pyridoxamine 5'-phosphate oxidase family protein n=1 Tax=Paenibacillus glacialis TaxID=494026 RepID=UPI003CCC387D